MSRHKPQLLLEEMRDFAQKALAVVETVDLDAHLEDWRNQLALQRLMFLIGEAAIQLERLRPELDLPWQELRDIRNLLAHAYRRVDDEILYNIAYQELPALLELIEVGITRVR